MSIKDDRRVVEMEFDNRDFEKRIQESDRSLSKFKKNLSDNKGIDSLKQIDNITSKFNLKPMADAVSDIQNRFTTLGIVAISVLSNIANKAVSVGYNLAKSFTIQPIIDGFREYETQIGAIQTIMANTSAQGTTLEQVNDALDRLNHYADKTIYNFTEMTRNIGTFTAAGVDLETSVKSIQGIANLAAVSGSTSLQASTAMYQLSQAIAAGTVKLMDWNSVVNAGMGGRVFQDALIRTSEHLQTGAKAAIAANGSFRESLQTGWLTVDVLTETLEQFAMAVDTTEEYEAAIEKLVSEGYTQEEAKAIADMAKTAADAATKVKTFSQLIDTLKEALGSGWTQTWEYIIGDFEQAKTLWTEISDVLSNAINESADARNAVMKDWADLGGRTALIDGLRDHFSGWADALIRVKKAFNNIFPPATAQQLFDATNNLKAFLNNLRPTEAALDKIERVATGVFSAFNILKNVLVAICRPIKNLITSKGFSGLASVLLECAASIGDFFTVLNKNITENGILDAFSEGLDGISSSISDFLSNFTSNFGGLSGFVSKIANTVSDIFNKIISIASNGLKWIKDNITFSDIFAGINTYYLVDMVRKLKPMFDTIHDFFDNSDDNSNNKTIKGSICDTIDALTDSLSNLTGSIKASTLLIIAGSVGILVHSLRTLSELDSGAIVGGLATIGTSLYMLVTTLGSMTSILSAFQGIGLIKASVALLAIGEAINILANALIKIEGLSLGSVVKGLLGISGMMAALSIFMSKTKFDTVYIKTSIGMLAIAEAVKILADTLTNLSSIPFTKMTSGLFGLGGVLLGLSGSLAVISQCKITLRDSVAILALAGACRILSDAVISFSTMNWSEIGRGLTSMGGALGEIVGAIALLNVVGGGSSLVGAASLFIVTTTLDDIASSLSDLAQLSWSEIGRGLASMGGALGELVVAVGALGTIGGFSSLLGSASLWMSIQGLGDLANAFKKFADISNWNNILKGIVGLGSALAEVGGMAASLGILAGMSGLLGGASLWLAVQSLDDLANAFKKFADISNWNNILKGIVGLGSALGEVALISGALGTFAGLAGILGGAAIKITTTGLGDLANAFKIFADMSWENIQKGVTGMQMALDTVAFGNIANSLGIIGSFALDKVVGPLGQLADSVKKWADITVPDNIGTMLESIADGVKSFGWAIDDGWGLNAVAGPLGTLADSVKKWADVIVPSGLQSQLESLANGTKAFEWAIDDGWGLGSVAGPLGTLADSVKKWSDVTVPENIGTMLQSLANGTKAFEWAIDDGWGLSAVAAPLGTLADSMKKWKDVTVPENIESMLKSLANGLSNFQWLYASADNIVTLAEPLGVMADSVKNWADIVIPEELGTNISNLTSGVNLLVNNVDIERIAAISEPLTLLYNATSKWGSIVIGEDVSSSLQSLGIAISGFLFNIGDSLAIKAIGLTLFANSLSGITTQNFAGAAAGIQQLGSSISTIPNSIATASSGVSSAIATLNASLSAGFASTIQILGASALIIQSKQPLFVNAGRHLMKGLKSGIVSYSSIIRSSIRQMTNNIEQPVRNRYGSMFNAGVYLSLGLANGIRSGRYVVVSAAAAVATAAIRAAKKALDEHSPSHIANKLGRYFSIGLANGIVEMKSSVSEASSEVASAAYHGLQNKLNSSNMNEQVTFSPVMSNTSSLNSLLANHSIDVNHNLIGLDGNGLRDIRGAIDSLHKDINKFNKRLTETEKTVNYTQNNYLSKNMDKVDIYRSTKNQLSRAKGGL